MSLAPWRWQGRSGHRSGYLKAPELVPHAVQAFRMIEPHFERPLLPRGLAVERPAPLQTSLAIGNRSSGEGQPRAYCLLVRRVHVVTLANIESHGHARIDHIQSSALTIANEAPIFGRGIEARDLHE